MASTKSFNKALEICNIKVVAKPVFKYRLKIEQVLFQAKITLIGLI